MSKRFGVGAFLLAFLGAAKSTFAQCALCYTYASAEGAHAQRQLDIGILVLLIPSLLLFVGVFLFILRRAHSIS